ncbi:hypothetical protein [Emticicia fluvialis]|nr:hypothetical protein [Emticicia fluvialis]
MMKQETDMPTGEDDMQSPILGTWRNVYIVVAGMLFMTIILFYFFTTYFA